MKKEEVVLLEESSNTHVLKGDVEVVKSMVKMNTIVLNTKGRSIVEHGEHAVVSTEPETEHVIKITQQEFNPLTQAMMNAFD